MRYRSHAAIAENAFLAKHTESAMLVKAHGPRAAPAATCPRMSKDGAAPRFVIDNATLNG